MAPKPEFSLIRATQLEALANITIKGFASLEYHVRRYQRWFSKTFFTPLAEVEKLPLVLILRTYYEELYEGMTPEQRATEKEFLLGRIQDFDEEEELLLEEFIKKTEAEETARLEKARQGQGKESPKVPP